MNSALGWGREIVKFNSALGWGRKTVKLNSALGWGRKIIGSTKISDYVIIGIDPSLGLSWHVGSLGLDQPMIDLGILFLK